MTLKYDDNCDVGEFCEKINRQCSETCPFYLHNHYGKQDECCYEAFNNEEDSPTVPSWFY